MKIAMKLIAMTPNVSLKRNDLFASLCAAGYHGDRIVKKLYPNINQSISLDVSVKEYKRCLKNFAQLLKPNE